MFQYREKGPGATGAAQVQWDTGCAPCRQYDCPFVVMTTSPGQRAGGGRDSLSASATRGEAVLTAAQTAGLFVGYSCGGGPSGAGQSIAGVAYVAVDQSFRRFRRRMPIQLELQGCGVGNKSPPGRGNRWSRAPICNCLDHRVAGTAVFRWCWGPMMWPK